MCVFYFFNSDSVQCKCSFKSPFLSLFLGHYILYYIYMFHITSILLHMKVSIKLFSWVLVLIICCCTWKVNKSLWIDFMAWIYYINILFLILFLNGIYRVFYVLCDLQMMSCLLLFQFEIVLFLSLAYMLRLGFPILYWKIVMKIDIFAFLCLILEEK